MMMSVYLVKVQLQGEPIPDRFTNLSKCQQCHQHHPMMQRLSHHLNSKLTDRRDQLTLAVRSVVD